MSRYIDAEALDKRRIDYIVDGYADSVDDMVEWGMAIIEAPTIDLDDYVPKDFHDKTCEEMARRHQAEIAELTADRPQGEWIAKTENYRSHWVCSECGSWALLEWNEQMCLSKYCPNCGARMKGADDE